MTWLRQRAVPGATEPPELGASAAVTSGAVLAALGSARRGTVYDLDPGRWPGMPVLGAHPGYTLTTYRTPRGLAVDGDLPGFMSGPDNVAFVSELMVASMHTGAHIDALSHVTAGADCRWHGGHAAAAELGDFGPRTGDGAALPPFVCRGVLVDVPRHRGVDALAAGERIDWADIEGALGHTELRRGDAVLIRTGYMRWWGLDEQAAAAHAGAGIGMEAAERLARAEVLLVGGDTESLEQQPSEAPDNALPVHVRLLVEAGVHICELLYLEDLAADGVSEFLFICLPLRLRGATGSMVRPIAVA
jgi:kynurenine formamidase